MKPPTRPLPLPAADSPDAALRDAAPPRPETPDKKSRGKKLYIKTHGCQMNVYDSERMADVLAPLGYEVTDSPLGADLAIVNTCHIREKAAEKTYGELGRLRRIKQERQKNNSRPLLLAVSGCVAQAEGEEMPRRQPALDLVVGPQAYHRLPQLLKAVESGRRVVETEFPEEDKFPRLPARRVVARRASAFVTIQEGCDRFCTFCVVPYTRGAEFSRPASDIAAEVRSLAESGIREITLLGQNVNAWHGAGLKTGETWSLARLLTHLADISGIERLRYTTSHPADMTPDLIAAHGEIPVLMPFVHLPVQSGSDKILKRMNRRHDVVAYHRRIEALRRARDDLALSSDFIVGFPGESRRDFDATLQLVRDVGYAQAYTFKYSPRPGTPAAGDPEQVEESEKTDRLAELRALLDEQQVGFNKQFIGRRLPVLFDRPGRRPGQIAGRSPYSQAVHLEAGAKHPGDMIGQTAMVEICRANANSLTGVQSRPTGQEQPVSLSAALCPPSPSR